MCGFLCDKYKKQDEDSIMYLQTLSQALNEFKKKRGVKGILSKNVRHPYTPQSKRRKISFAKTIQNLKKKMFGELPRAVIEEVKEYKNLNIYKHAAIAERTKELYMTGATVRIEYNIILMKSFTSCFRGMRHTQINMIPHRIPDLNFYTKFLKRYKELSDEATIFGGRSIKQLVDEFEWDEDMIDYVRGIRLYLGGMDWIVVKRILIVMNMNNTHFVTLEILLNEGHMNVYDCQLMGMEYAMFLTYVQLVFELLPKLLKHSGIMKHLPEKFLNEPWEFKDRTEPMVKNAIGAACGSYSPAFIEHLVSETNIQPPKTLLCGNLVERMQWVGAYG